MWPAKKKKQDSAITVHELEIKKLKLEAELKKQKSSTMACWILFLVFLLVLFIFSVD